MYPSCGFSQEGFLISQHKWRCSPLFYMIPANSDSDGLLFLKVFQSYQPTPSQPRPAEN